MKNQPFKIIRLSNINFIFSCLCFYTFNLFSQQNYFEIKPIKSGADLSFPILKNNTKDSMVIEKINYTLQLSELKKIDKKNADIFSIIKFKEENNEKSIGYKNFTIESNTNKLFSLKFNSIFSYPPSYQWQKYYTFNSTNGNLIHLQDIFTKKGFQLFKSMAIKRRLNQLTKEIEKNDKSLLSEFSDVFDYIKNDEFKDFYIKDTTIYIDEFNRQGKYQRVYGLNLITKYKLKELKPFLNQYGKALFGLANDSFLNFQTSLYPQLYKGFVRDSFPIVMLLEKHNDTSISGYYVYTKFGIGIELNGSLIGNKLSLTEQNGNNKTSAIIDATYSNALFTGFWQDIDRKKKYKFFIRRY